jgi:hypothetical protein
MRLPISFPERELPPLPVFLGLGTDWLERLANRKSKAKVSERAWVLYLALPDLR